MLGLEAASAKGCCRVSGFFCLPLSERPRGGCAKGKVLNSGAASRRGGCCGGWRATDSSRSTEGRTETEAPPEQVRLFRRFSRDRLGLEKILAEGSLRKVRRSTKSRATLKLTAAVSDGGPMSAVRFGALAPVLLVAPSDCRRKDSASRIRSGRSDGRTPECRGWEPVRVVTASPERVFSPAGWVSLPRAEIPGTVRLVPRRALACSRPLW